MTKKQNPAPEAPTATAPTATAPTATAPTASDASLVIVATAGEHGQRAASAVTAAVKALFADGIRAAHLAMVDGKPAIPSIYNPILGAIWRGIESASTGLADVRARMAAGVAVNDGEKLWVDSSARLARATMGRIVSGLIKAAADADTAEAGKTVSSADASEDDKAAADEKLWVEYYAALHDGMKRVLEKAQGERAYQPMVKALREAAAEVVRLEGEHAAIRAATRAKATK